ncbi:MAG: hypothetical protein HOQ45_03105 [Nocardioidaceae bacterium]|nr:hypothetical protein [Nocardioidaceae bacterium]
MAILIFPIGLVLGWLIRPPHRAAVVTAGLGGIALAVLVVLLVAGVDVSPLETLVLLFGTPIAAVSAFHVSRWRLTRTTRE